MQHHKEAAPPPSLKPSEDNSDSQWWRHPPHPIIPWSQGLRDYHCNICKFTMCLNNISFHTSRFCLLAVLVLSLTKISGCFYFEYFNSNLKPDACLKTNLYGNLWILNAVKQKSSKSYQIVCSFDLQKVLIFNRQGVLFKWFNSFFFWSILTHCA